MLAGGAALFVGLTVWSGAHAQTYPNRSVRLMVPASAGGVTDLVARIAADYLSAQLKQQFVVENRTGAGGNLATDAVAKANPDGYTLGLVASGNVVINPYIYKSMPFDPLTDLIPVASIAEAPQVIAVNKDVPAKSLAELIALAKAQPGRLNFASSGYGAAAHLAGELFKTQAQVDIVHVAYKGAAPALQDLIAGHVQLMFATAASVVPHIKDGLVRPLAVTTLTRTAVLPDIPTVSELGIAGFDATTWHGLVAPAGTPPEIIAALHRATVEALNDPATRKALGDLGVDIVGSSPAEFAAYIKAEIPKWSAVVKAAGARLD
jgi:tripartite-type tricarboxylate transporter receptor subunit TctC